MAGVWRKLRRTALQRKTYNQDEVEQTNLRRCLTRWDLTALGVGSTLGVGVYVLIGLVAVNFAGPSIVLSFLIASVVALFAGLCFAEFSARIPKAGAAYSYTFVALGEALAFLVGWCNILELVFGSASVAKGLSMHMDEILDMTMTEWFQKIAPISASFIAPYFDLFACLIVLIMGALLSFGVHEVSLVNKLFSALNMAGLVFIVAVGAFAADAGNWSIPSESVPAGFGKGGFFPFGVWGTVRGAAICFVGFVGFDSVCAAGEEAREPRRVIPLTIVLVLLVTLVSYTSVAIVITMMVPYYMQDPMSSVSRGFLHVGWVWAKWVVCFGSLFGLYASLFGAMFPLPRLLYSMSRDGVIGGAVCLSRLTAARQSPAIATLLPTLVIATLAGLFDVEALVTWMCTGTLFSYTAVASSVIIMRYRSDYTPGKPRYLRQVFGVGRFPSRASSRIVHISLAMFMATCVAAALVVTQTARPLVPSAALHAVAMLLLIVIAVQPANKEQLLFKTPLVPLIPCLSIYCNIHMMVLLSARTWLRAAAWLLLGILVYCARLCCRPRTEDKATVLVHAVDDAKPPVQIIVESPTPPDTIARGNGHIRTHDDILQDIQEEIVQESIVTTVPIREQSIQLQQAYIENNEEKEAKIIDLLDEVLRAEEDTYGEAISLKTVEDEVSTSQETAVHRKSLSELSDAGSDASLGYPVLSKYDVVAQVHREDLPRLREEEETSETEDADDEQVTAFNDSDTNSRTDESGYSDTIDRNASESLEEIKQDVPYIPVPPPMDESYFRNTHFKKSYTIASKHSKPPPPPSDDEDDKPRESIKSNSTLGEDNITFGSDRQVHFMSKLNNIFQTKISSDEEEPRQRSRSTGNVVENMEFAPPAPAPAPPERPPMFMALRNEITSKEAAQNLRPVNADLRPGNADEKTEEEEDMEDSMSRQDLKSKLENIFAAGGPLLLKPRLMKSNPGTPDDAYQTDTDAPGTESIPKLPKMEKNDTLKRQKDKFSAVLNSFRLSFKDDDDV